MSTDERDNVELPALEQLQSLGWSYVEAAELSPKRFSFSSSMLSWNAERESKQIAA